MFRWVRIILKVKILMLAGRSLFGTAEKSGSFSAPPLLTFESGTGRNLGPSCYVLLGAIAVHEKSFSSSLFSSPLLKQMSLHMQIFRSVFVQPRRSCAY